MSSLRAFRFDHVALGLSLVFACAGLADPVEARVGVTSETNGDPLGKPPTEDERVLRVGIDIQADELITTRADDRAHLVFLDGTALTVSPNAQLKVDRFVYDPQSRRGEIAITATKGVFRLVGGRISKTTPIVVRTPASTIGIRGGIGLFTVDGRHTTAQFLFGNSLQVTGGGQTQTAVRPGTEIRTSFGGVPGAPTLQALEAARPRGGSSGGGTADDHAQRSGFSRENSGRGPGATELTLAPAQIEKLSQAISGQVVSQAKPLVTLPTQTTTNAPAVQPVTIGLGSTPPPPPPITTPTVTTPGCDDGGTRHRNFSFRR